MFKDRIGAVLKLSKAILVCRSNQSIDPVT